MGNLADTLAMLGRVGVMCAVAASDAFAVATFVYPNHLVCFAHFTVSTGANGRRAWSRNIKNQTKVQTIAGPAGHL